MNEMAPKYWQCVSKLCCPWCEKSNLERLGQGAAGAALATGQSSKIALCTRVTKLSHYPVVPPWITRFALIVNSTRQNFREGSLFP